MFTSIRQFLPYLLISLLLITLLPVAQAAPQTTTHAEAVLDEQPTCHEAQSPETAPLNAHCLQDSCLCLTAHCSLSMLPGFQPAIWLNMQVNITAASRIASVIDAPVPPLERPPRS